MAYVKWTFIALVALLAAGFLHYTLPRHNVMRIVETEVRRVEVPAGSLFWGGSEPGDSTGNRDVKFISGVTESGTAIVFRNEDTGWGWPPYYKFDSADLQARAADSVSSREAPEWMLVRYYGWRSNLFSIFPNALAISPATGPDMRVIPWFNIVVLSALAALVIFVRMALKRFWRNRVDPVVARVAEGFDNADDAADAAHARFRGTRQKFREWWTETFG
ncbi:DUF1523 family protein [Meridianimarinicoccus sp. RP-17]|uniref:DUF1523 family protein n=1 Tax=Meridianimarinicoccus zhengii TaxID=2056810 RepID=UPI000DAE7912|nr:DUF1523 family protein [Phycocomes zhengii]